MGSIAAVKNSFLRGLSAIYLFAFASLYVQVPGKFQSLVKGLNMNLILSYNHRTIWGKWHPSCQVSTDKSRKRWTGSLQTSQHTKAEPCLVGTIGGPPVRTDGGTNDTSWNISLSCGFDFRQLEIENNVLYLLGPLLFSLSGTTNCANTLAALVSCRDSLHIIFYRLVVYLCNSNGIFCYLKQAS